MEATVGFLPGEDGKCMVPEQNKSSSALMPSEKTDSKLCVSPSESKRCSSCLRQRISTAHAGCVQPGAAGQTHTLPLSIPLVETEPLIQKPPQLGKLLAPVSREKFLLVESEAVSGTEQMLAASSLHGNKEVGSPFRQTVPHKS